MNENSNIETSRNRNNVGRNTSSSSEKSQAKEDILKMLEEDINKETDSIKREHLLKIYNAFYNK